MKAAAAKAAMKQATEAGKSEDKMAAAIKLINGIVKRCTYVTSVWHCGCSRTAREAAAAMWPPPAKTRGVASNVARN